MLKEIDSRPSIALARWTRTIRKSALQEMLWAASGPDVISFALGKPAGELLPAMECSTALLNVLSDDPNALQYGPPSERLKSHIVELMNQRGVKCTQGQVFLTSGAQQGMNLLTRLLLEPGGRVAVERLAYTGFTQVLEPYEPETLAIDSDPERGMNLEFLEAALSGPTPPAFIYAISDGHNPLGIRMSLERRARLAELASRYCVPIMEDDAYGFLYYDGEMRPALKSYNSEWVLYVGSFSKLLAPALRVGWLVVPEDMVPKLAVAKEASDIDTATLAQRAVCAYLQTGEMNDRIHALRREYSVRRSAMTGALKEHFPADASWVEPSAGVFVWVRLNSGIDTTGLLRETLERDRVAFIPGSHFCVGDSQIASSSMRLNFSYCRAELIEEGISRLGRAIKRTLDRTRS